MLLKFRNISGEKPRSEWQFNVLEKVDPMNLERFQSNNEFSLTYYLVQNLKKNIIDYCNTNNIIFREITRKQIVKFL